MLEQTELSCKLALSAFLSDVILPEKSVFSQTFRSGQILSDIPRGIPSIGLITAGRVEVYSVALDGKDILLNELSVGECFGICNFLAALRIGNCTPLCHRSRGALYSQICAAGGDVLQRRFCIAFCSCL